MSLLRTAIMWAYHLHANQRRKYTDRPYIEHPLRVMGRYACMNSADEYGMCAAILHDVMEDCGVHVITISNAISPTVAILVAELTNTSKATGLPRGARKKMDRERIGKCSQTAKIIKLIDRIDNLGELPPCEFRDLYVAESELLLPYIADGDEWLAREYAVVIEGLKVTP